MSDINFVEVDAQEINKELVNDFETALGETLYPGDERRIFLEQEGQVIVGLKNSINDTGRQNLLRYARGEVLDAMGERLDTPRLQAQKAKVTLRFTLSAAQTFVITIPQGTRATPDGQLYFATTQTLVIQAGQTYGDVLAESTEGGEKYNGFAAGQIKTIVDPIAYVASVQNIDTSSGGSDIEPDDDGVNLWSGYRERIRQAPNKTSTAGHEDGYIYWAKTADVNIQDVAVTSPAAGQIKITVLMKDGQLPTQQVLDAVLAACSDKKRRPLTDQVTAAAPTTVNYDITLTYYISQENAANEINIRNAIEGTNGAIDQYKSWQKGKLGRAINPDYLKQLILNAGAYRVDITAPIYTAVDTDKVASEDTVTITYGGLI
jgi:phage-related baseplate assembly protein